MIRGIGFDKPWELAIGPVECAAVNDHAADGCAMTTNELGSGMHDDIRAVLEWLHQVGCRQRVIEDERQPIFMRDIGDRANVQRIQARIADCFREHGFGTLVDSGAQVLRVAAVKETGRNADLGQRVVEQVVGAAAPTP